MANPNIVLPDIEDQLDWDVLIDGAEKPLRYLDGADLRALAAGSNGALYARVADVLGDGHVVEDLDPATFLSAFWGDLTVVAGA